MKRLRLDHRLVIGLLLILCVGFLLRSWRAAELMRFTGDEARDLRKAKAVIAYQSLSVTGPKIYRGQGNLGPAYTYLMAIPLWIAGYDPATSVWVVLLLDTLAIGLVFLLTRELMGSPADWVAAGLYAVSFTAVFYARWGWHPSLLPFFTLLAILGMIWALRRNPWYIVLSAACLAVLVQLHASAVLIAVPLCWTLWLLRKRLRGWILVMTIALPLIILSPVLLREIVRGFSDISAMFGMKSVLFEKLQGGFPRFLMDIAQAPADQAYWPYGIRVVLAPEFAWMYWINIIWLLAGIASLIIIFVKYMKKDVSGKTVSTAVIIGLWLVLIPFSLIMFGGQRSHYYMLSWFPVALITAAAAAHLLLKHPWSRWLMIFILGLSLGTNLLTWSRYVDKVGASQYDTFFAGSLKQKKEAVSAIVQDAAGASYDVQVVSWYWSNYKPYAYLFDNAANPPRTMHVLEVNLETKKQVLRRNELGDFIHWKKRPKSAKFTYFILEPKGLIELPGTILIADLGQLSVLREEKSK
ncbi:MAG: glycosyltransferase family 39 protein [Candidatus Aminicenantes bacterium]|nr:glycosyltransferase family 39 protein [Candidatus Aminicenantes bacterium]